MSDVQVPPEPGALRLVGTLTVAGFLAGLLLAATYELTLPTITANAQAALRAAVFQVVPGTTSMRKLVLAGERFVVADGSEDKNATVAYAAYGEGGALLGFALPADGPGFQDTIKLIYGYDPSRAHIVGMQVLESRETPGLGDKIFKDPKFAAEFDDLACTPEIKVVKHGTGSAPHEVDGITGATISSKSVVRILNEQNRRLLDKLPARDALPPAPTEPAQKEDSK
ncbi:MAG: FMN-binding protein [Planctomycetota bacterium]